MISAVFFFRNRSKMRLFIAVNLTASMKDALINAQSDMDEQGVRGNYTKEENLHLTLAFIGEFNDPDAVLDALQTFEFRPFEITLDILGRFGDLWWAGLKSSQALEAVARRARRALAERGIPFDRKRFSPHITLLRNALGEMPDVCLEPARMTVDCISLMRSDRGKSGMIYTELGKVYGFSGI